MKQYTVMLIGALLAACSSTVTGEAGHDKPVVTVSIPPQAWLLESIAGDSVKVNVLMNRSSNPETFEPGVSTMKAAAASDVLMLSGALGFESTLAERISSNNPKIKVTDTSVGIDPIYGTHVHAGHSHHHHVHGDVADPHTWTSVRNARVIAGNMLSALLEIDPENADYYKERAARLDAKLDSMDRSISERLDTLHTKAFMVWHPSLSYFARDYNLEQINIGNEGRESTIPGLRAIVDKAASKGCRVLFIQADFDSRQAMNLSSEIGAEVVTINPMDKNWELQISTITDALSGK